MSSEQDGKGFLSRWSQRKAEARRQEVAEPAAAEPEQAEAELPDADDPLSLPSVEDLNEASDFTPFLRKGVPEGLRKAALRKLWVTEPSVVNYVPLVEYAWHNNEPGFGPLLPTDDVEKLLKQIIEGNPFTLPPEPDQPAGENPAEIPAAEAPALESSSEQPMQQATEPQDIANAAEQPARPRRHGGALPG